MTTALTVSTLYNPFMDGNIPYTVILDWTAAADGSVSFAIASTYNIAISTKSANPISVTAIRGRLRSVETIPGTLGDLTTALPTAYDLTILDKYSYDILAGSGSGRSASVAEKILPSGSTIIINSELTLTIANAGSGGTGRILLEFEDTGTIKL